MDNFENENFDSYIQSSMNDYDDEERFVSASKRSDDVFENVLRPKTMNDYIGQGKVKENLSVFITAAKKRNEPL